MSQCLRLLIVDDEENVLTTLKRVFRGKSFEVSTAPGGEQGLAILIEREIDVIISDMRMPEMDGAEFLARSRTIQPNCRRILLTGYSDEESLKRAVSEGRIHQFLGKPWSNDELRKTVMEEWELKLAGDDS